jgi:hypothetical protein
MLANITFASLLPVYKHSGVQSDWDVVERDIEKERLEARISELQDEKSEMARTHHSTLVNVALK